MRIYVYTDAEERLSLLTVSCDLKGVAYSKNLSCDDSLISSLASADFIIVIMQSIEMARMAIEELCGGIEEGKLLNWNLYMANTKRTAYARFGDDICYKTFIFGMSHARLGILSGDLRAKSYNFACDSMDLWYQHEIISRLIHRGVFFGVDRVLIEMPYYYFNYDVSRTGKTFTYSTRPFYEVGKYHHYKDSYEGCLWIKQFEIMANFDTGDDFLVADNKYKRILRGLFRRKYRKKWTTEQRKEITNSIAHVWRDIRQDTVEENTLIWKQICRMLNYNGIKYEIEVMPMNPIFFNGHIREIENMKQIFYGCVGEQCAVSDNFKMFQDETLFSDYCHMNFNGAYIYTKRLNKRMLGAD